MKEIKKYIAFNPASSDSEEWWSAESLEDMKNELWASCASDKTIIKTGYGYYSSGDIEIYNVKLHPRCIDTLE